MRLSADLSIVIEIVDTEEKIQNFQEESRDLLPAPGLPRICAPRSLVSPWSCCGKPANLAIQLEQFQAERSVHLVPTVC
jgi:Uncharacterized ACR, COG1993